MSKPTDFPIKGVIQDYAWGGYDFLAELTGRSRPASTPWAELWLGAHPKGPAMTSLGTLDKLIAEAPEELLGQAAAANWNNRLPFLLKVLDVREMLSIQAHPNKASAKAGFAREETNGPARTAPNRNYRDDNHKPELGVALTDFYLLHGFKSSKEIEHSLETIPAWDALRTVFQTGGVKGLYAHVMQADQAEIDALLLPLQQQLKEGNYRRSNADFWAQRAFQQYTRNGEHFDRGIFSIYWFNLVHLLPGQGIFQDAGIPHAYLEGVCVELMANSDNVLRGGLTVKHIDVPELMKNLLFDPVNPQIIVPRPAKNNWKKYDTPAPDFQLTFYTFNDFEILDYPESEASVYLVMNGKVRINGQLLNKGEAYFISANSHAELVGESVGAIVYRASVKSD